MGAMVAIILHFSSGEFVIKSNYAMMRAVPGGGLRPEMHCKPLEPDPVNTGVGMGARIDSRA